MKKLVRVVVFTVVGGIWWSSCKKDEYKNLDCSTISSAYTANIKPIIDANCVSSGCHNAGSNNGDFTSYTGVHGKVNNGSFEKRVLNNKDMPSSGALSLDNRKKIKCWIDNGALNN